MEEDKYEVLMNLVQRLDKVVKEQGWEDLETMILGQVIDTIKDDSIVEDLMTREMYLMRLLIRYETFKKSDFNIVVIDDRNERFRIGNYDYNTFVWAKKKVPDYIDNNFIYVPFNVLNEKEREHFKGKAVNNYE